jgi:3'-5' exonuclease
MRKLPSSFHKTEHVAVLDIETIVPGPTREGGGFPKWPLHRPIVASLLTARENSYGQWDFSLDNIIMEDGGERAFYAAIDELLPEQVTLVTANGRGFDVPNLALGAMAAKQFDTANLSRQFRANRYGAVHADICDLYSGYGGAPKPSLSEICGVLGIPVKMDTHGSEVADLVAAGELDRVVRYCASDVAATYVAWLHYAAFRDGDEHQLAEPLACFARWIKNNDDLAHLLPIAQCEPAIWAKDRALHLAIARGKQRAQRHIEVEEARGNVNRNMIDF